MTIDPPHFSSTPFAAQDPIFALTAAYQADPAPEKITLGPGAYYDDTGKLWALPSVVAAEAKMAANPPGHGYLPILGLPAFIKAARTVIFGANSPLLSQNKVATVQTISGTGAVHMAGAYLKAFHKPGAVVYVSNPSWTNHRIMFEYEGFEVVDYPYYHPKTKGVDYEGFLGSLRSAKSGDVFILHPAAHNPTGCDLTHDQWVEVGQIIKERNLVPVLDSAYQGFASGDLDYDAWPIRHILETLQIPGLVCQSFSKNMGLYGERAGALHVVVAPQSPASLVENIEAQLSWITRKEISTSPRYGATIVATIVEDPELYRQWTQDMKTMSARITAMRQAVVDGLTKLGTPGSWKHVTEQIGMFSYTGLTRDQVLYLKKKHVYMSENGRASICGLTTKNVQYFCECVDEAVRNV